MVTRMEMSRNEHHQRCLMFWGQNQRGQTEVQKCNDYMDRKDAEVGELKGDWWM